MLDYPDKIEEFIKKHFEKCDPADADVTYTNSTLLANLFTVFPENCISDFQLYDILMKLGHEKQIVSVTYSNKQTSVGPAWCFKYLQRPVDVSVQQNSPDVE